MPAREPWERRWALTAPTEVKLVPTALATKGNLNPEMSLGLGWNKDRALIVVFLPETLRLEKKEDRALHPGVGEKEEEWRGAGQWGASKVLGMPSGC